MQLPDFAILSGTVGYSLAALFALCESLAFVGLVVPGALFMAVLGEVAREGIMSFWLLTLTTSGAAIFGDAVSYELGRHGGALLHRWPRLRPPVEQAKRVFHGHALRAVVLGKFIGALRPLIPFVAGMTHMPRWRFYLATVPTCVAWAVSYLGVGYLFGQAAARALSSPWAVAAILALALLLYGAHRVITRRVVPPA